MSLLLLIVLQTAEPAGFAQGAIDLTTFKWYSTYSAMKHVGGLSVVSRHDAAGAVACSFTVDEAAYGEITGSPWWDNGGGARWLTFTTAGGWFFRVDDLGNALQLSPGYPVDLGVPVSSTVISDGFAYYFGGDGFFGAWNGGWLWMTSITGSPVGMPAYGDALFVATDAGRLYALDIATGAELAQAVVGGPVLGGVSLVGSRVAVADLSGRFSAFDGPSLVPAFTYDAGAPVRGGVFMSWVDGRAVFGDDAGFVHVVDASGAAWGPGDRPPFPHAFEASPIASAPLFEADLIYIGNENGTAQFVQYANDVDAPFLALGFPGPVRDFGWADPYDDGVGKILLMAGDGMHQLDPIVPPPSSPYVAPVADPVPTPATPTAAAAPAGGRGSSCSTGVPSASASVLLLALALSFAAIRRS